MHALRNNISQLVDPDVNMLLNLFGRMVTPVLSYGIVSYRKSSFTIFIRYLLII